MPRLNGNARLTGAQAQDFRLALLAAFSTLDSFDVMVKEQLSRGREQLAVAGSMKNIVFRVIETADDEGWTCDLLLGARQSRPHNPELLDFALQFGLAPGVYEQKGGMPISAGSLEGMRLERLIVETNSPIDVVRWREQLAVLESQVCRIEVPTGLPPTYGTGFLVGSSTVITNHHVMIDVIRGLVRPEDVILRFDYKQRKDGVQVNAGTVYHLADDWKIDESPISPLDLAGGSAEPDRLDYVLMRVKDQPGCDPAGGSAVGGPDSPRRGWIGLPAVAPELRPGGALFILQHPKGDALKLALDTNAIIGINTEGTRATLPDEHRQRFFRLTVL